MTQLLEKACERISLLTTDEQDEIATIILDELDAEEGWRQRFGQSADLLSRMTAEALAEHRAGKTKPLNPDRLCTHTAKWNEHRWCALYRWRW